MPRTKKLLRQRPTTLKEMNDSLAAWNPLLEEYNRQLRETDTPEEKLLQQQGQATYPERLAKRRKERKAEAALPPCPITEQKPDRRVSNYSIVEAIAHIPGLPKLACTVLQSVGRHWNIELQDSWLGKERTALECHCSEHSVSDYWTLLERANFIRSKPGTDRKGDSRLRPDKPRAGGVKRTNHWWLNIKGIFALAYPKTAEPPKQETTSPFERGNQETTTENQETTTSNQEVVSANQETPTENQVVVSSDSSSYPSSEKKRESEREKEGKSKTSETPTPSLSFEEAKQLVEMIKQTAMELTENASSFDRKSSAGLLTVVREVNPTEAELKAATIDLVSRMDNFELKNCGSRLEAGLAACILTARAREKEIRERRERESNPEYKAQQELAFANSQWKDYSWQLRGGASLDAEYSPEIVAKVRAAFIETLSDEQDKKVFDGTSPSPVRLPFQSLEEVRAARAWRNHNSEVNQRYEQFFEQWSEKHLDIF
jgi:hypothetical protein